jgi:hypothetical protein
MAFKCACTRESRFENKHFHYLSRVQEAPNQHRDELNREWLRYVECVLFAQAKMQ